jgi:hypothetical protein
MAAKQLKPTWCDDLKAESDLRRLGVPFEKTSIKFSDIDLKESQVNGARLEDSIIATLVDDYMQGFRNGDNFPRPIVHKTATGYVILSGNQRSESIRRLIEAGEIAKTFQMEVYLVDTTDPLLLEIIARSGNVAHGGRSSKEERMSHAVYSVRKLGMRSADAAKIYNVSATNINMHIRAEDERRSLAESGIDTSRVANAALEPLARLKFDEPAKKKLGSVISQYVPTAERVRQVVGVMAKAKTTADRFQQVKELERELSAAFHSNGNGKHHANGNGHSKAPLRPRRDKLVSILTRLANFLDSENDGQGFTSLDELQVASAADIELINKLWKRLSYRMKVVLK